MGRPKLELNKRTTKTIVSQYGKGMGLVALAEKVQVSIPVIRRILVENDVAIRDRGRPVVKKTAKK